VRAARACDPKVASLATAALLGARSLAAESVGQTSASTSAPSAYVIAVAIYRRRFS
jgi:hypothetical protein